MKDVIKDRWFEKFHAYNVKIQSVSPYLAPLYKYRCYEGPCRQSTKLLLGIKCIQSAYLLLSFLAKINLGARSLKNVRRNMLINFRANLVSWFQRV